MIQILKNLLKQWIDDIDSGNTNIDESQQKEIIELLQRYNSKELSKLESADYIGVSRATLSWNKFDLDKFLETHGQN